LRACQRAGVDLRTNAHVESIDTTRTSATATVGSEVHRGDVVIAADGLNSSLRQRFSDDQPVPSGYAAYRGAIPVDNLSSVEGLLMNDVIAYIGPGCHFVQYALRGGEMFNQVAVFRSPAFLRGEQNWGGPEELEAAFERCTPQIRRAMTHLWTDRFWPMYDREPISNWVDGRLALSGDAAHPMLQYLAQGACQAIEDAANLAWHATTGRAGRRDDWGVALAAYQADRTVRTARVQTTARTWGDIWHSDGLTRTLRNAMFRDRPIDDYRYVDWLYGLPAYSGSPVAQQQAAVPVHSGS
jgi:salicylate hydroxylase